MPVLWWPARTRGAHLPPLERLQALSQPAGGSSVTLDLLTRADLVVLGALADASNLALLVRLGDDEGPLAIYKPIAGERPLWDFPDGSLAAREVAAHLISTAGGWDVVPETVLRDGPRGPGSVQRWVGDPQTLPEYVVDLVTPDAIPEGWLSVLRGEDERGKPVVVVHEDSADVRGVAAFDAVINNSDRKGSHLVREGDRLRGFDHGVSLHQDDKLRTVLWGFAGHALSPSDLARITTVGDALGDAASALRRDLAPLLTTAEVTALEARCGALLERAAYPMPSGEWPAIPWPPL